MKVADAFDYLVQEEEGRLIDMDQVNRVAVERVESSGIIFLDEIDKIAGREGGHGPDVSREGVQRDILPIVEGTTVNTRYGMVRTDHILFIAAGAFHVSKPSDLIPELQGRFPIRVELQSLTVEDFLRILTEPKASLTKQCTALLETEGVRLEFAPDALREMAEFAFKVNEQTENIGARRLHTIMERVLEDVSFLAPDVARRDGKNISIWILEPRHRVSGRRIPNPSLLVLDEGILFRLHALSAEPRHNGLYVVDLPSQNRALRGLECLRLRNANHIRACPQRQGRTDPDSQTQSQACLRRMRAPSHSPLS
jgi:hypothetical protein